MKVNKNDLDAAFEYVCDMMMSVRELKSKIAQKNSKVCYDGVEYSKLGTLPEINHVSFDLLLRANRILYLNPTNSLKFDTSGLIHIHFESFFSGCCLDPSRVFRHFKKAVKSALIAHKKKELNFNGLDENSLRPIFDALFEGVRNTKTFVVPDGDKEKIVGLPNAEVNICLNSRDYSLSFTDMNVVYAFYNGEVARHFLRFNTRIYRKGSSKVLHKLNTIALSVITGGFAANTAGSHMFIQRINQFALNDLFKYPTKNLDAAIKAKYSI